MTGARVCFGSTFAFWSQLRLSFLWGRVQSMHSEFEEVEEEVKLAVDGEVIPGLLPRSAQNTGSRAEGWIYFQYVVMES